MRRLFQVNKLLVIVQRRNVSSVLQAKKQFRNIAKLVSQLWNEQRHHEAISVLRENNKGPIVSMFLKEKEADMLMAIQNYHEAIDAYQQVIDGTNNIDVNDKMLLQVRIGQCYYLLGDMEKAQEILLIAADTDKSDALPYERLGNMYCQYGSKVEHKFEMNQYLDIAIKYYQMALQREPQHSDAHYGLGVCLQRREKYEDSIKAFTNVIQGDSKYYAAVYNRADCYFIIGKYKEAMKDYELFLDQNYRAYVDKLDENGNKVDPESIYEEVLFKLGACSISLGDYPVAETYLKKVINYNARNQFKAQAHNKLGYCYFKKHRWWECVQENTKAIELDPELAEAYKDRSEAYKMLNQLKEAERDRIQYEVLLRKKVLKKSLSYQPQMIEFQDIQLSNIKRY